MFKKSYLKLLPAICLLSFFSCLEIHASAYSFESPKESGKSEEEVSQALLKTLLQNPGKALREAQKVNGEIAYELESSNDENLQAKIARTLETYAHGEKTSPIFLLDECDAMQCPLSRCNTYEYRRAYEDRVVPSLVMKIKEQTPLRYVSFGSGKMFQDLVILTKALAQEPKGAIVVHLIDAGYINFCDYRHALQLPVSVDLTMETLPDLHHDAQERLCEMRAVESLSPDRIRNIQKDYVLADQTARQFVKFLRRTFKDAEINVLLHKNKDDYIGYIHEHAEPYPDIVTSADIQDDYSFALEGIPQFRELCKEVLLHKSDTHTSLLAVPGKICSFSLAEGTQDELMVDKQSVFAPYSLGKYILNCCSILLLIAAITYTTEYTPKN